jgi:uncharacterized protein (TIGR04255 family)
MQIIEVDCVFSYSAGTNWDLTVPGTFFEGVKERFPIKETLRGKRLMVKTDASAQDGFQPQVSGWDRIRFLSKDRADSITLDERTLWVSKAKPFDNWQTMIDTIGYAYKKLAEVTVPEGLDRIGLRTIHKIEVPMKKFEFETYFNFRPTLDGELSKLPVVGFFLGVDTVFNDARDICRMQFTPAVPEKEYSSAFILDLDYFLAKPRAVSPDGALVWIAEAQKGLDMISGACIRETLKKMHREAL